MRHRIAPWNKISNHGEILGRLERNIDLIFVDEQCTYQSEAGNNQPSATALEKEDREAKQRGQRGKYQRTVYAEYRDRGEEENDSGGRTQQIREIDRTES